MENWQFIGHTPNNDWIVVKLDVPEHICSVEDRRDVRMFIEAFRMRNHEWLENICDTYGHIEFSRFDSIFRQLLCHNGYSVVVRWDGWVEIIENSPEFS